MSASPQAPPLPSSLRLVAWASLTLTVAFLGVAYVQVRDAAVAAWRAGQQDAVAAEAAQMGITLHLLQAIGAGVALETFNADDPEGWMAGQAARVGAQLDGVRILIQDDAGRVLADSDPGGPDASHPHAEGIARSVVHCEGCADSGFVSAGTPPDDAGRRVVVLLPTHRFSPALRDPWAWVVDADGLIIAHADPYQIGTRPFGRPGQDPHLTSMLIRMAGGARGTASYQWAGRDGEMESRLAAFAPIPGAPRGWAMAASQPRSAALAGVHDALRILGAATLGALLLAATLAGGVLLAQRRAQQARETLLQERMQLTQAAAHAERLAMLGTLTAGVAHDLRSPLSALTMTLEMLGEGELGAEQRALLADAALAARRLQQFAGDLTGFSRGVASDERSSEPQRCLELAVRLLGPRLRVGTRIDLDLPDLPPVAMGEQRLSQVLMNLMDNAAQVADRVRITGQQVGDRVTLWVDDNGPGIPEDLAATLFEPFVTSKPAGEGTGLGLFLCRRFVEEAGGTIDASAGPMGGVRFALELPVCAETQAEKGAEAPAAVGGQAA